MRKEWNPMQVKFVGQVRDVVQGGLNGTFSPGNGDNGDNGDNGEGEED